MINSEHVSCSETPISNEIGLWFDPILCSLMNMEVDVSMYTSGVRRDTLSDVGIEGIFLRLGDILGQFYM